MLAETVQELLLIFRGEVHDLSTYTQGDDERCLWSDDEIINYMSEAADALATKVGGIVATLTIPYAVGATSVALPERVLHIQSLRLVTADQEVEFTNQNRAYRLTTDTGRPAEAYRDRNPLRLYLHPVPSEADSLEVVCLATLSEKLEAGEEVPFTKAEDQRLLLEYMKWRAYSKQNAETEDLVRASKAQAVYENGVLERESSLRNQRRAPGLIQMEW